MYRETIFPCIASLTARDPEVAHQMAIKTLCLAQLSRSVSNLLARRYVVSDPRLERTVAGICFPRPVGLAAGFDKECKVVGIIPALGFGFATGGTVLPRPQAGNPRPRIFRLLEDQAIINRCGFNSGGVPKVLRNLEHWRESRPFGTPRGISLGVQKETPSDRAWHDQAVVMRKLYLFADYFELGISSPNTPGLRDLQHGELLTELLKRLQGVNTQLATTNGVRRKPLFVKLAPDLSREELEEIVPIVVSLADGIVATNTTIGREGLNLKSPLASERGGLSGRPLAPIRKRVLAQIRQLVGSQFPLIGVGGFDSPAEIVEGLKIADLVQVYTGFVYQGPRLIRDAHRAILEAM